jgi:hypothetical protein
MTPLQQQSALRCFGRAFLIVMLTASNVRFIAAGAWGAMFLTGTALSFVWWGNTRAAAVGGRLDRVAYALGAGCGTICGAFLAGRVH